jgi:isoquinoline 1-oxidoreductase beta subunit
MLVATAAKRWSVDPSAGHTEKSAVLRAATGKRLGYGALVVEARSFLCP